MVKYKTNIILFNPKKCDLCGKSIAEDNISEINIKFHAKKALLLFIAILCLTLSGCSRTLKQIKNGDVQTDEYNIDHTNLDNQDIFYVIPITTTVSNGKGGMSTSVTYVPMWTETDHLKITYWSNGHKKLTTSLQMVVLAFLALLLKRF
uniref:hypothetical protein n=1 Tax=Lentilactobacillus hilgardii TaxID=1588 RepID=UPI00403F1DD9